MSTTDPESGVFHKGEHKRCFAYEAHTVCDKHNFILDTVVTSGNVHDSVAFDALYERVTKRFPEIKIVTMDAGYKTPWICKRVMDDGRITSSRQKTFGIHRLEKKVINCVLKQSKECLQMQKRNME